MDPTTIDLLSQHGVTGAIAVAVLLLLRNALHGGIAITVKHDPTQIAQLGDVIRVSFSGVQRAVDELAEDVAAVRERTSQLEIVVAERTERQRRASLRPTAKDR